jgi:hypothetical protein
MAKGPVGKKEWTLQTVLQQFDRKCEAAFGYGVLAPESPVRDESIGDLIQMLVNHDYGLPVSSGLGKQLVLGDEKQK